MIDAETRDHIRSVVADVVEKGAEPGSWAACAQAGLLGLTAPTTVDGSALAIGALQVLLHEAGRRALDLPFWDVLCGALPCYAAADDRAAMSAIVTGGVLVGVAVNEVGATFPERPRTEFDGHHLSGVKVGVRAGVDRMLVTASGPQGPVVVEIAADQARIRGTGSNSSAGLAELRCEFQRAPARLVGGAEVHDALLTRARAGLLAYGAGLLAGARDLTAGYVKEREQFGRPLATFQGVAMQLADVFITSRLIGVAVDEIFRRIEVGESAVDDLAIASHWYADRAPAALQTCHHLHGGVGVDITYPMSGFLARTLDVVRHLGSPALADVPSAETEAKNAELTMDQRAFKDELRDYFAGLASDADREEILTNRHGPAYHRIIASMGGDGRLGVGWPTEFGGQGRGGVDQQIFANEAARADIHLPAVTLQTVGPTLQRYGTAAQRAYFLPRILRGELHFAIGYSEPDAGTDLAALRTTARREGDHYIVNGQKMWTTGAHAADYLWLAVRTDPDAPKHQGISILIVDTKDPGFSWTPIVTCDGSHHVNATYFNEVRVPVTMLVGEENRGWQLITTQLNHERVMLGPAGRLEGLRDRVLAWAAPRRTPCGEPLLQVPQVHAALAATTVAFRLNELLNWQVAAERPEGAQSAAVADASASKVFASEEVQRHGLDLLRAVAAYGDPADPETTRLLRQLDLMVKRNLVLTFGGGVNEVQRELIAMFGLGLPKVPR